MNLLDSAYRDLLTFGLLRIRDLCDQGNSAEARIEAEHIHNVPSLIGEGNKHRHAYYLEKERFLYMQSLKDLGGASPFAYLEARYMPIWGIIETEVDKL